MTEFKVGDRVRSIWDDNAGIILSIEGQWVTVRFPGTLLDGRYRWLDIVKLEDE